MTNHSIFCVFFEFIFKYLSFIEPSRAKLFFTDHVNIILLYFIRFLFLSILKLVKKIEYKKSLKIILRLLKKEFLVLINDFIKIKPKELA